MASQVTVQQIQETINVLYEGTSGAPAPGSEDYLMRQTLINNAIMRWENDEGYLWHELWTNLEEAADGISETSPGQSTYVAPGDFKFPGGFVYLYKDGKQKKKLRVVSPDQVQNYENSQVAYFTGSPAGSYLLNIQPAPEDVYQIGYDYYKFANRMTAPSQSPEMSNPQYITHAVVAELHKIDRNMDGYTSSLQDAEDRLREMEIRNTMMAPNQTEDISHTHQDWGFGR